MVELLLLYLKTNNMHKTIENIIRTNLPEKKKVIVNMLQDDELYNERGMDGVKGFNQALSQINPSLIADEVLKVVVEKIMEVKYSSHNPTIDCTCETCFICNKLLDNF